MKENLDERSPLTAVGAHYPTLRKNKLEKWWWIRLWLAILKL